MDDLPPFLSFHLGQTVQETKMLPAHTQLPRISVVLLSMALILLDECRLRLGDAVAVRNVLLSPGPNGGGEVLKNLHGRVPVDTGISDTNALLQTRWTFGRHFLVAFVDVGLDHHTNDGLLAFSKLISDDLGDLRLVSVVLVRIAC